MHTGTIFNTKFYEKLLFRNQNLPTVANEIIESSEETILHVSLIIDAFKKYFSSFSELLNCPFEYGEVGFFAHLLTNLENQHF